MGYMLLLDAHTRRTQRALRRMSHDLQKSVSAHFSGTDATKKQYRKRFNSNSKQNKSFFLPLSKAALLLKTLNELYFWFKNFFRENCKKVYLKTGAKNLTVTSVGLFKAPTQKEFDV